jgi:hypothetical protein
MRIHALKDGRATIASEIVQMKDAKPPARRAVRTRPVLPARLVVPAEEALPQLLFDIADQLCKPLLGERVKPFF